MQSQPDMHNCSKPLWTMSTTFKAIMRHMQSQSNMQPQNHGEIIQTPDKTMNTKPMHAATVEIHLHAYTFHKANL